MSANSRYLGYYTAVAIVIANMVGTGVFTSLGYQVVDISDGAALLAIWLLGGLIALCGALAYSELSAALPRSGGEYHFLGRIYHPVLGTVTGWVTVSIGFAAPIALAAIALGRYAAGFTGVSPMWTAMVAIVAVTLFHAFSVNLGQRFHVLTTVLKLVIMVVFIIAGIAVAPAGDTGFEPGMQSLDAMMTPAFGVALIYVSYAYLGWNAATYVVNEMEHPQRVVPKALFQGTLAVMLFYLALNYVFLRTVPLAELAGKVEVGALSAAYVFGQSGGMLMSAMLCLLLVSTISAMVLAGPRVIQVIGEDNPSMAALAVSSKGGAPLRAIVLQSALALMFVATDSFEGVLTYAGFTLTLFSLLTVLGVFVLRFTEPELPRPYRTWGYPVTPLVFIVLNTIMLVFVLQERPWIAALSLTSIVICLVLALWFHRRAALAEPES